MFAFRFRFLAGRYHATPWGLNVNEADVAWPPEPWRLLPCAESLLLAQRRPSTLVRGRGLPPDRCTCRDSARIPLAGGRHPRTYSPLHAQARGKKALIFDAFVRLPEQGEIVAGWPDVQLDSELFAFAADLAASIGYLGRAESWTECEALADWHGKSNCGPMEAGVRRGRGAAPCASFTYRIRRRA